MNDVCFIVLFLMLSEQSAIEVDRLRLVSDCARFLFAAQMPHRPPTTVPLDANHRARVEESARERVVPAENRRPPHGSVSAHAHARDAAAAASAAATAGGRGGAAGRVAARRTQTEGQQTHAPLWQREGEGNADRARRHAARCDVAGPVGVPHSSPFLFFSFLFLCLFLFLSVLCPIGSMFLLSCLARCRCFARL